MPAQGGERNARCRVHVRDPDHHVAEPLAHEAPDRDVALDAVAAGHERLEGGARETLHRDDPGADHGHQLGGAGRADTLGEAAAIVRSRRSRRTAVARPRVTIGGVSARAVAVAVLSPVSMATV